MPSMSPNDDEDRFGSVTLEALSSVSALCSQAVWHDAGLFGPAVKFRRGRLAPEPGEVFV